MFHMESTREENCKLVYSPGGLTVSSLNSIPGSCRLPGSPLFKECMVFLDFAKFKVIKTSLSVGFRIVGDATATSHTSVDGWIISMNTSHSWLPTFMPQLFGVLTGQKCWETDTAGCPLLCGCFLCKPKPCKKAPEDLLDVLPNRRRKGNGMQWDLLAFLAAFDLLFSRSPVYEHLLSGGLAVVSLDLPRNCAVDLSR